MSRSVSTVRGGGRKNRTVQQEYEHRLKKIYRHRAPDKITKIQNLLNKHQGKEHELYEKLCKKYKLKPNPQYFGPPQQDEGQPGSRKPRRGESVRPPRAPSMRPSRSARPTNRTSSKKKKVPDAPKSSRFSKKKHKFGKPKPFSERSMQIFADREPSPEVTEDLDENGMDKDGIKRPVRLQFPQIGERLDNEGYDFGSYFGVYARGIGYDVIEDREASPPNPDDFETTGGMTPMFPWESGQDSQFPEREFGEMEEIDPLLLDVPKRLEEPDVPTQPPPIVFEEEVPEEDEEGEEKPEEGIPSEEGEGEGAPPSEELKDKIVPPEEPEGEKEPEPPVRAKPPSPSPEPEPEPEREPEPEPEPEPEKPQKPDEQVPNKDIEPLRDMAPTPKNFCPDHDPNDSKYGDPFDPYKNFQDPYEELPKQPEGMDPKDMDNKDFPKPFDPNSEGSPEKPHWAKPFPNQYFEDPRLLSSRTPKGYDFGSYIPIYARGHGFDIIRPRCEEVQTPINEINPLREPSLGPPNCEPRETTPVLDMGDCDVAEEDIEERSLGKRDDSPPPPEIDGEKPIIDSREPELPKKSQETDNQLGKMDTWDLQKLDTLHPESEKDCDKTGKLMEEEKPDQESPSDDVGPPIPGPLNEAATNETRSCEPLIMVKPDPEDMENPSMPNSGFQSPMSEPYTPPTDPYRQPDRGYPSFGNPASDPYPRSSSPPRKKPFRKPRDYDVRDVQLPEKLEDDPERPEDPENPSTEGQGPKAGKIRDVEPKEERDLGIENPIDKLPDTPEVNMGDLPEHKDEEFDPNKWKPEQDKDTPVLSTMEAEGLTINEPHNPGLPRDVDPEIYPQKYPPEKDPTIPEDGILPPNEDPNNNRPRYDDKYPPRNNIRDSFPPPPPTFPNSRNPNPYQSPNDPNKKKDPGPLTTRSPYDPKVMEQNSIQQKNDVLHVPEPDDIDFDEIPEDENSPEDQPFNPNVIRPYQPNSQMPYPPPRFDPNDPYAHLRPPSDPNKKPEKPPYPQIKAAREPTPDIDEIYSPPILKPKEVDETGLPRGVDPEIAVVKKPKDKQPDDSPPQWPPSNPYQQSPYQQNPYQQNPYPNYPQPNQPQSPPTYPPFTQPNQFDQNPRFPPMPPPMRMNDAPADEREDSPMDHDVRYIPKLAVDGLVGREDTPEFPTDPELPPPEPQDAPGGSDLEPREITNLDLSILDLPDLRHYSLEDIPVEYGTPKDIFLNLPEVEDDNFDENPGKDPSDPNDPFRSRDPFGRDPSDAQPPEQPGKEKNRNEPKPEGGDRDEYDNYVPPLPLDPRVPDEAAPPRGVFSEVPAFPVLGPPPRPKEEEEVPAPKTYNPYGNNSYPNQYHPNSPPPFSPNNNSYPNQYNPNSPPPFSPNQRNPNSPPPMPPQFQNPYPTSPYGGYSPYSPQPNYPQYPQSNPRQSFAMPPSNPRQSFSRGPPPPPSAYPPSYPPRSPQIDPRLLPPNFNSPKEENPFPESNYVPPRNPTEQEYARQEKFLQHDTWYIPQTKPLGDWSIQPDLETEIYPQIAPFHTRDQSICGPDSRNGPYQILQEDDFLIPIPESGEDEDRESTPPVDAIINQPHLCGDAHDPDPNGKIRDCVPQNSPDQFTRDLPEIPVRFDHSDPDFSKWHAQGKYADPKKDPNPEIPDTMILKKEKREPSPEPPQKECKPEPLTVNDIDLKNQDPRKCHGDHVLAEVLDNAEKHSTEPYKEPEKPQGDIETPVSNGKQIIIERPGLEIKSDRPRRCTTSKILDERLEIDEPDIFEMPKLSEEPVEIDDLKGKHKDKMKTREPDVSEDTRIPRIINNIFEFANEPKNKLVDFPEWEKQNVVLDFSEPKRPEILKREQSPEPPTAPPRKSEKAREPEFPSDKVLNPDVDNILAIFAERPINKNNIDLEDPRGELKVDDVGVETEKYQRESSPPLPCVDKRPILPLRDIVKSKLPRDVDIEHLLFPFASENDDFIDGKNMDEWEMEEEREKTEFVDENIGYPDPLVENDPTVTNSNPCENDLKKFFDEIEYANEILGAKLLNEEPFLISRETTPEIEKLGGCVLPDFRDELDYMPDPRETQNNKLLDVLKYIVQTISPDTASYHSLKDVPTKLYNDVMGNPFLNDSVYAFGPEERHLHEADLLTLLLDPESVEYANLPYKDRDYDFEERQKSPEIESDSDLPILNERAIEQKEGPHELNVENNLGAFLKLHDHVEETDESTEDYERRALTPEIEDLREGPEKMDPRDVKNLKVKSSDVEVNLVEFVEDNDVNEILKYMVIGPHFEEKPEAPFFREPSPECPKVLGKRQSDPIKDVEELPEIRNCDGTLVEFAEIPENQLIDKNHRRKRINKLSDKFSESYNFRSSVYISNSDLNALFPSSDEEDEISDPIYNYPRCSTPSIEERMEAPPLLDCRTPNESISKPSDFNPNLLLLNPAIVTQLLDEPIRTGQVYSNANQTPDLYHPMMPQNLLEEPQRKNDVQKYSDCFTTVNDDVVFWDVTNLPTIMDSDAENSRENSPSVESDSEMPIQLDLRPVPPPIEPRQCSFKLFEEHLESGAKIRSCTTGFIDNELFKLPEKSSLLSGNDSVFVKKREGIDPKIEFISYLDLPRKVVEDMQYPLMPIDPKDPASKKWVPGATINEDDGKQVIENSNLKQKALNRKRRLSEIRKKLRSIKSNSINSIHEVIEDDMDASYDDVDRIKKRKGTFDMIDESRQRLDNHTNKYNLAPIDFNIDDVSDEEEQHGDVFARTKRDMTKQLNLGIDAPKRKRDRSPLFDDSVEISRRPSARRSLTRTTTNESLYDSGANGTTEEYYSRIRADMQKSLNTDFTLGSNGDSLYSRTKSMSSFRSQDYSQRDIECPYWWRDYGERERNIVENVLRGESKITHRLIIRIVKITRETERNVEHFLRWWFYVYLPSRNRRKNLLGIRKNDDVYRTRSALPAYRGEDVNEDIYRYGRTHNELGKTLNTNLETRTPQNRLLKINIEEHHHIDINDNELKENYKTKSHLDKLYVKNRNRIVRSVPPNRTEREEHFGNPFARTQNDMRRVLNSNIDPQRRRSPSYKHHTRRFDFLNTEDYTKRSTDRGGRRKRAKEEELKPYRHRKKIRKDHLVDSEEDEADVFSEKDYGDDFRRRLLGERADSRDRVQRALDRSKEHIQNFRNPPSFSSNRASQLKKSINETLENIASLRNRNPYEEQNNQYLPDKHLSPRLPRRSRPVGFMSDGEVEDRRFDFDDPPNATMSETNANTFIKNLSSRRRPGNSSALNSLINRNSNTKRAKEAKHLAHLLRQMQADNALQDQINSQLFDMIDIDEFPLHIVE